MESCETREGGSGEVVDLIDFEIMNDELGNGRVGQVYQGRVFISIDDLESESFEL